MPRTKGVTQLELLRKKQAEIAEQLKAAEAKERDRKKQRDTRRREILGGMIDDLLLEDPKSELAQSVFRLAADKLTNPADRALFPNLPALTAAHRKPKAAAAADRDAAPPDIGTPGS